MVPHPARPASSWATAASGRDGFYAAQEPTDHFRTSASTSVLVAEAVAAVLGQRPDITAVLDVGAGGGHLLTGLASLRPDLALTGVDLRSRPGAVVSSVGWLRDRYDVDTDDWESGAVDTWFADLRGPGLVVATEFLDDLPLESGGGAPIETVSEGVGTGPAVGCPSTRCLAYASSGPTPAQDTEAALPCPEEPAAELARVHHTSPRPEEPAAELARVHHTSPRPEEPAAELARVQASRRAWAERWWPDGDAEVGLHRDLAWAGLVRRLRRTGGLALMVDYGHLRTDRPTVSTLAAFRGGRAAPATVRPDRNLTAHVAVDAVADAGVRAGATTLALLRQREALTTWRRADPGGALDRLVRQSERRALTGPGLGDHWWLLQSVEAVGKVDLPG